MSRQMLPIAVAVVLIAAATYVQGSLTERWGRDESEVLDEWGARIDQVPLRFGDWVGTPHTGETDEGIKRLAGFSRELDVRFHNERTGQDVEMVLMVGPGRRVSVHTPDKCLRGAGFALGEQPSQRDVKTDTLTAQFLTSPFHKESPEKIERLRVLWTWNNGESWQAPTPFWAKMRFSRAQALYKLYLFSSMAHSQDKFEDSDAVAFAREFLPLLTAALFPDSLEAASSAAPAEAENAASPNEPVGQESPTDAG